MAASILALDGNNNLWAYGYNTYGQLANGTTSTVSTPTKVGENIKDFDIGYYHSAVISGDYDALLFAGTSYYGQIPYQKDATTTSNIRTSFTQVGYNWNWQNSLWCSSHNVCSK
jgi:alpha-tubulin suppressor-like RCC1 family protein